MRRRPKITAPILGWSPAKGFNNHREAVKTDSANKHVRKLRQETRKLIQDLSLEKVDIKVCVCPLSPHDILFLFF